MNNKLKKYCILNCALISCTTQKSTTHIINNRDSTYVEQLTPHLIPPDSTTINALLRCDSFGQVYISQIKLLSQHNNTLSFQLDSLGNLNQTITHLHDTIWIPHSETKITEKNNSHAETHQIDYRTPPLITKILIIETLIIAIALLFYLAKKRFKQ
jgi:hypothetical protein